METIASIVVFVLIVMVAMTLWGLLDKAMSRGVDKVADKVFADRQGPERKPGPLVRFLGWLESKFG